MLLVRFLVWFRKRFSTCPRIKGGYSCLKNDPSYSFYCPECRRFGDEQSWK